MEFSQALGVILMIVTSHGQIDPQHPTGLWLEEFSVPYDVFTEAGYEVVVASPEGGEAPIDPRSLPEDPSRAERNAMELLKKTRALDPAMLETADAVFFSGGHGTMFDFPEDPGVKEVVETSFRTDTPIALVCHGPAALVGAVDRHGNPVVKGRKVTGFTNREEEAVELTDEMPFLLETRLKEQGATFKGAENFQKNVVVDGHLITGQNPASSRKTAEALLRKIQPDQSERD